MHKININSIILFMLIMLSITTTSCNSKSKEDKQTDKLTIGVMSSIDYLPIAVAKERGYFDENSLDVTIQKFYSANDRDAALQSGNLDGTILDYTGGAIQLAGGIPIKFVSQCDGTFEMIVAQNSNIESVKDLKDKNIAISRNTVIDYCTSLALAQAQLSIEDITASEINKIPLRLEMLNNSKIDATMLPDPFATIAKSEGNKYLISMDDMQVKVTGIAFHQKTIDEKKEALQKLYKAYNKAVLDLNSEPITNFEDVLIKEVGVPANLSSSITLPHFEAAQPPHEEDLLGVEKWLKEKTLVPNDFNIAVLVATGIIE